MPTVETHAIPGVLARHVTYLAACKGCGKEADWPVTTKRDAERELRYDGWDVVAGRWLCPQCVSGVDALGISQAEPAGGVWW